MARATISARDASDSDAPALRLLWREQLRPGTPESQLDDVRAVVAAAAVDPRERLVVVECDGRFAGAALLQASTTSPINLDPAVRLVSPQVLEEFRRHGVGTALVEAAVLFAEQLGIQKVSVAAAAGSRDAHRFLARLALTPQATVRIAETSGVRARLAALRHDGGRGSTSASRVEMVLAARRLRRRTQEV